MNLLICTKLVNCCAVTNDILVLFVVANCMGGGEWRKAQNYDFALLSDTAAGHGETRTTTTHCENGAILRADNVHHLNEQTNV